VYDSRKQTTQKERKKTDSPTRDGRKRKSPHKKLC